MKFIVYKEKLSVDVDSLTNADVRYLWDLDDSNDKSTAIMALLYVFFVEDLSENNPLSQIPFNKKEEESLFRAFGTKQFDIEQELGNEWYESILTARNSYKNSIPDTLKDIATFDRKMDELGIMLRDTQPKIKKNINDNNDKISFTTNIAIINKSLTSVISIIQSKASIVSMHVQGVVPKHLRGGLSPMSKGKIKTPNNKDV